MSDELILALYPPPPPFAQFFSEENEEKLNQFRLENPEGEAPGELRFLEPPKQPEGTHYSGYGNLWSFEDRLPLLKDTKWDQLYQSNDELITLETKITELHKLVDLLLLNFLELIGMVSVDPSKAEPKINNISLILININHLLNTYRPHQSRESLIMLLKKLIEAKRKEIEEIDVVLAEIRDKIAGLTKGNDLAPPGGDADEGGPEREDAKMDLVRKLLNDI